VEEQRLVAFTRNWLNVNPFGGISTPVEMRKIPSAISVVMVSMVIVPFA
jgi:hypothetical protein